MTFLFSFHSRLQQSVRLKVENSRIVSAERWKRQIWSFKLVKLDSSLHHSGPPRAPGAGVWRLLLLGAPLVLSALPAFVFPASPRLSIRDSMLSASEGGQNRRAALLQSKLLHLHASSSLPELCPSFPSFPPSFLHSPFQTRHTCLPEFNFPNTPLLPSSIQSSVVGIMLIPC